MRESGREAAANANPRVGGGLWIVLVGDGQPFKAVGVRVKK